MNGDENLPHCEFKTQLPVGYRLSGDSSCDGCEY